MTARAVKTPIAAREFRRRAEYLYDISPATASRFLRAAEWTFQRLAEMPGLGGRCEFRNPEFADIRVFPIKRFPKYLVFYRPIPDGVLIIRILHSSQDIESIFESMD
jgi:toxin ParE1/3/4